jgi:hypothetical protein
MNLFSDPWIPCADSRDRAIVDLISGSDAQLSGHPVSRMAIVRLLMAVNAWVLAGGEMNPDWWDLATAFQMGGLPEASARSPIEIIDMTDGNGVAWSPLPAPAVTERDTAIALITAYSCDRGGFKARVEGLPISGQVPLHLGQRFQLVAGANITEVLANNPVKHDSDYQPPWVAGMIYPEHKIPRDELELLLWPWRRLQITPSGIVIAPGAPIEKTTVDPWSIGKASLKHLQEPAVDGFETIALVLNQAMPVACWVA